VRGDLENAVASIDKVLKLTPSRPDLVGIRRELQNRLAVRKENEADFEFFFKSGIQNARKGDLQAAIDIFLKAGELKKTGSLMYNLGLVSHQLNNDEAAIAYLKESLAINPSDMKARSLMKFILHHRINVVRVEEESKNY